MGRRVLLVEGENDEIVVSVLLIHHEVPKGSFRIEQAGNVDKLLAELPTRLKESDLERCAAIVDADVNLSARWESLRARVLGTGYVQIPAAPAPGGTILEAEGLPRLGLWLMPNNALPGILEDFLAFLVPAGDALLPLVDGFLDGIPTGARRFGPERRPKARIHAWLAVQNEPGKPLGQAITARYLDAGSASAAPFVAWLRAALVD